MKNFTFYNSQLMILLKVLQVQKHPQKQGKLVGEPDNFLHLSLNSIFKIADILLMKLLRRTMQVQSSTIRKANKLVWRIGAAKGYHHLIREGNYVRIWELLYPDHPVVMETSQDLLVCNPLHLHLHLLWVVPPHMKCIKVGLLNNEQIGIVTENLVILIGAKVIQAYHHPGWIQLDRHFLTIMQGCIRKP